MDKRERLEETVRALRSRYTDGRMIGLSESIIRQIKENWTIARDTLAEFDQKNENRANIIYTAQGNRAQKFREGL